MTGAIVDRPCGPFVDQCWIRKAAVRATTIGQTPGRESDKQRLEFRTETDTEEWRAELVCEYPEMRTPAE
jgi:hypothetical protein